MKSLVFEEVEEKELFLDYSAGCSGDRSDCCTRVCTNGNHMGSETEWGKFLAVEGGVIQY